MRIMRLGSFGYLERAYLFHFGTIRLEEPNLSFFVVKVQHTIGHVSGSAVEFNRINNCSGVGFNDIILAFFVTGSIDIVIYLDKAAHQVVAKSVFPYFGDLGSILRQFNFECAVSVSGYAINNSIFKQRRVALAIHILSFLFIRPEEFSIFGINTKHS